MEARLSQDLSLAVELSADGLEPTHRAHQAAVQDFIDFTNETPGVHLSRVPVEPSGGTKGAWEQLVLEVASPSGAAAVVALFRLWLHRDRKRSVRVTIRTDDRPPVEVEANGESISLDALKAAIEAAFKSPGKQQH